MLILDDSDYTFSEDLSQEILNPYKLYYGRKERHVASATDVHTPTVHISVQEKLQSNPAYKPLALVDMDRSVYSHP